MTTVSNGVITAVSEAKVMKVDLNVKSITRLNFQEKKANRLEAKWSKKYSILIKSWSENWPYLSVYFQYPQDLRTIIYTTSCVEALHRQLRKVTKANSQFPNDESLTKMIYLAYQGVSKKWSMPQRNCAFVISKFSITFQKRLKDYL